MKFKGYDLSFDDWYYMAKKVINHRYSHLPPQRKEYLYHFFMEHAFKNHSKVESLIKGEATLDSVCQAIFDYGEYLYGGQA
jgi:hypothetical protein